MAIMDAVWGLCGPPSRGNSLPLGANISVGARVVERRGAGLYGRPPSVPVERSHYGRSLGDCVAYLFSLLEVNPSVIEHCRRSRKRAILYSNHSPGVNPY